MKYWLCWLVLLASSAFAGEVKVVENPVPTNSYAEVVFTGVEIGDSVEWDVTPDPVKMSQSIEYKFDKDGKGIPVKATLNFNGPAGTKYRVMADVVNFKKETRKRYRVDITISGTVPIPPTPVPPNPVPPTPTPLTSFRVIFVYESADTLTLEQRAVIYGRVVEDYLNANCTGGKTGWRRRDKDVPGEADKTMAELWDSVKPAKLPNGLPDPNRITVTPCVVMERNGKVEINNLDTLPTKMVETLTKYREGK